ncbi:hypothetical protein EW146_g7845 [Bondarzewia mesenterica]|uniref:Terpene synthase n=1 Tax=Bondarzewia mesenterica TaxID=1095465 RepID=A0A4S4LJ13_9AGAM|nr:hypothetical protein EW146_g7845 [Bondarzewia mesenterica]
MTSKSVSQEDSRLADLLADWPWSRSLNPLYEEVKAESSAWVASFKPFNAKAQDAFDRCDFGGFFFPSRRNLWWAAASLFFALYPGLFAALAYPNFDKARLRTCMDIIHFFFVFDAYSDVADEVTVNAQREIIMDALRHPHTPRPDDECVLGEMARQMWARASPTATPRAQKRFVETFDVYTAAVVTEAKDRCIQNIRNIESYLSVRRCTVGVMPCLVLLELKDALDESIAEHPAIIRLEEITVDMMILENDTGLAAHNIVNAIIHEKGTDVHGALQWVEQYHDTLAREFLEIQQHIPLSEEVEQYVWGIGNWLKGVYCWHFESGRYFRGAGLQLYQEMS